MKRKITALLAITMVIAVANFPLHFIAYRECYVKPFRLSQPEWSRPYINCEPFFSTWYGISTIVVWLFLGVLWLVAFPVSKKFKENRISDTVKSGVMAYRKMLHAVEDGAECRILL